MTSRQNKSSFSSTAWWPKRPPLERQSSRKVNMETVCILWNQDCSSALLKRERVEVRATAQECSGTIKLATYSGSCVFFTLPNVRLQLYLAQKESSTHLLVRSFNTPRRCLSSRNGNSTLKTFEKSTFLATYQQKISKSYAICCTRIHLKPTNT
jgi:hypothetical protein